LATSAPERAVAAESSAAVLSPTAAPAIPVAKPPAAVPPPESLPLQPQVPIEPPLAAVVRPAVHDHVDEGAYKGRWAGGSPKKSVRRGERIRELLFDLTESGWKP
jgi:hypothetical protein